MFDQNVIRVSSLQGQPAERTVSNSSLLTRSSLHSSSPLVPQSMCLDSRSIMLSHCISTQWIVSKVLKKFTHQNCQETTVQLFRRISKMENELCTSESQEVWHMIIRYMSERDTTSAVSVKKRKCYEKYQYLFCGFRCLCGKSHETFPTFFREKTCKF